LASDEALFPDQVVSLNEGSRSVWELHSYQ